eukprot:CAMPEP_0167758882 /NCGR_PEP_ID=MMETSP0110_2-20121227/10717_1 /TAXON_ID=629695 /ORGANISM="Gymnochlora sp., Strain CCMP2014" /LENGTH=146 /DNA_ID=CAMNT_0007645211 /DNA_START=40 /DNA_END=481 /DNA_ORIENTATION=-
MRRIKSTPVKLRTYKKRKGGKKKERVKKQVVHSRELHMNPATTAELRAKLFDTSRMEEPPLPFPEEKKTPTKSSRSEKSFAWQSTGYENNDYYNFEYYMDRDAERHEFDELFDDKTNERTYERYYESTEYKKPKKKEAVVIVTESV